VKKFLAKPSAEKAGEMQSMVDKAVRKALFIRIRHPESSTQLSKKIAKKSSPR